MSNLANMITVSHTWIVSASSALCQHSQIQKLSIYCCMSPRVGDEGGDWSHVLSCWNACIKPVWWCCIFRLESCTLRMVLRWFEALAFAGNAKHFSRPVGFSRFVFDPCCLRAKILWKWCEWSRRWAFFLPNSSVCSISTPEEKKAFVRAIAFGGCTKWKCFFF